MLYFIHMQLVTDPCSTLDPRRVASEDAVLTSLIGIKVAGL
jgi:hypothetical protein